MKKSDNYNGELKIIFDHIPKTGGTSVHSALKSIFGKKNSEQIKMLNYDKVKSLLNKFDCVSGHIWFSPENKLMEDVNHLTILRHPIDRIISQFYWFEKGKNLSDYVFSEDPAFLEQNNFQTQHYLKQQWDGINQLNDFEKIICAKKALQNYEVVGVYHQLTDFLDIICYEFGWSRITEIPHLNVASNRPKLSEIDPKIIRRLEELNQLDLALYEYATQLFNEKKRQVLHECIERRHRELNASSTHLLPLTSASPAKGESGIAPSPTAPLPEGEENSIAPAPADFGNRQLEILAIEIKGDISLGPALFSGETARIRVIFRAHIDVDALTVGIHIHDRFGRLAFGVNSECLGHTLRVRAGGVYSIDYHFRNDLGMGEYTIGAALHLGSSHLSGCFHWRDEVTRFEVVGNIGYHFEGVAKLYPQLRCGVLEGDPAGIQAPPTTTHDWPRLQQIAIHTPELTEFSARLRLPEPPQRILLHQVISLEAEITNASSQTWGSTGQRPVYLSYHWQAPDGGWLEFDGERTPLPRDLAPGETIRHFLIIKAPPQPGPARLHLTLVQEGVGWFDQHGCPALIIPVSIEE